MLSLDIIEQKRPRNPHGPAGDGRPAHDNSSSFAKMYFVICLALFSLIGVVKMTMPANDVTDEWSMKGDASGGWGAAHNHPVKDNLGSGSTGVAQSAGAVVVLPPLLLLLFLLFLMVLLFLLMGSWCPPLPVCGCRHGGLLRCLGCCPQHRCSVSGDEDGHGQTTTLPAP